MPLPELNDWVHDFDPAGHFHTFDSLGFHEAHQQHTDDDDRSET